MEMIHPICWLFFCKRINESPPAVGKVPRSSPWSWVPQDVSIRKQFSSLPVSFENCPWHHPSTLLVLTVLHSALIEGLEVDLHKQVE